MPHTRRRETRSRSRFTFTFHVHDLLSVTIRHYPGVRVAGWCRLPAVAVAGFVHVHVHGVFVPYTRRREARAQPRARSQSVTIGGSAGRPLSRVGDMARLDALTPQEGIPDYRPATDDYQ